MMPRYRLSRPSVKLLANLNAAQEFIEVCLRFIKELRGTVAIFLLIATLETETLCASPSAKTPRQFTYRPKKSHRHLTPSRAVDLSGDIATLTASQENKDRSNLGRLGGPPKDGV